MRKILGCLIGCLVVNFVLVCSGASASGVFLKNTTSVSPAASAVKQVSAAKGLAASVASVVQAVATPTVQAAAKATSAVPVTPVAVVKPSVPLTVVAVAQAVVKPTAKVVAMEVVSSKIFYDTYSPSVLGNKMWLGGWVTAADVGTDRLFVSQLISGKWQDPTPIKWTNISIPGVKPGFIINDPSVVVRGDNGWQYMYYTALAEEYKNDANAMQMHNLVGFASSSDNGMTWYDHHLVINQDNGFNNCGAWSPSALIVFNSARNKDEVWVYYHSNQPDIKVYRTRMEINGWQRIATEKVNILGPDLFLGKPGAPFTGTLLNVDVVKQNDGSFWMVANDSLNKVVLYISTDGGMTFRPYDGKAGELINGNSSWILTPHIQMINNTNFNIYFGYGDRNPAEPFNVRFGSTAPSAQSLHRWQFELNK